MGSRTIAARKRNILLPVYVTGRVDGNKNHLETTFMVSTYSRPLLTSFRDRGRLYYIT